jgi:hypothetical protein
MLFSIALLRLSTPAVVGKEDGHSHGAKSTPSECSDCTAEVGGTDELEMVFTVMKLGLPPSE